APTRAYAASANALPSPAPVSTRTSWPRLISSSAPAGVSATRYSSDLTSFATPILTARDDTAARATRAYTQVQLRRHTCTRAPVRSYPLRSRVNVNAGWAARARVSGGAWNVVMFTRTVTGVDGTRIRTTVRPPFGTTACRTAIVRPSTGAPSLSTL